MSFFTSHNITYDEFKAINQILHSHLDTYSDKLRSLIGFGRLVATGETYDIELLAVVDNWKGPRRVSFHSTDDLPLRGRLTIYFLTPKEFEKPGDDLLPGVEFSARTLLYRVEPAYTIFFEQPGNYAFDLMQRFDTVSVSPQSFFATLGATATS